jgi:hypothetical protein
MLLLLLNPHVSTFWDLCERPHAELESDHLVVRCCRICLFAFPRCRPVVPALGDSYRSECGLSDAADLAARLACVIGGLPIG